MRFLDWCQSHKILVAVYPPHSTHRLQPLDVGLFSPLAIYYSQRLDAFIHQSQGLSAVTKRDFLQLFWPAYQRAFSVNNILSAWSKTGIHPLNPAVILSVFKEVEHRPESKDSSSSSALSTTDWRKIRSLLKEVVTEVVDEQEQQKVHKLNNAILTITTQNALLKAQNQGFKSALIIEKKRRKRGRGLFEELRAVDSQGATFFSPTKIQQAKDLQVQRDRAKEEAQQQKVAQSIAKKLDLQLQQEVAIAKRLERSQAAQMKKDAATKKAS
nr:hypothetical protein CFP56_78935 [Quercus suber]